MEIFLTVGCAPNVHGVGAHARRRRPGVAGAGRWLHHKLARPSASNAGRHGADYAVVGRGAVVATVAAVATVVTVATIIS